MVQKPLPELNNSFLVSRKKMITIFNLIGGFGGGSYQFNYTDIPSAPSDGTSATITYSAPGNILNSTGGTTQNKYLSGVEYLHVYELSN